MATNLNRKLKRLLNIDFTKKTKNQAKSYLKKQFESLGIKPTKYIDNPTPKNIEKGINRIKNEIQRQINTINAEREELNRITHSNVSDTYIKTVKSYNTKVRNTLNKLKQYYPDLSDNVLDYLQGKEVALTLRNKTYNKDDLILKEINPKNAGFSNKKTQAQEIIRLRKEMKRLTFSNYIKEITDKRENKKFFEEFLDMSGNPLSEKDKTYLKTQFNTLNAIQQEFAIKTDLGLLINRYKSAIMSGAVYEDNGAKLFNTINYSINYLKGL